MKNWKQANKGVVRDACNKYERKLNQNICLMFTYMVNQIINFYTKKNNLLVIKSNKYNT